MSALINICLPQSMAFFARSADDSEHIVSDPDVNTRVCRQELTELFRDQLGMSADRLQRVCAGEKTKR